MRFLFASDSFKGTISSAAAARLLTQASRAAFPEAEVRSLAVADGGEGTVEAVVTATGGTLRQALVLGPLGKPTRASFGLLPDGRAIVEMAAASGLPLLAENERNPLRTSTYGTGELIRRALDEGASSVSLALGGSATNDCGMGCMRALGVRFLDEEGVELEGVGADLARVRRIDLTQADDRLATTGFSVMCDVDNPLLGPRGATRVFGPQKGADPAIEDELERGMESFARVLAETFPSFDPSRPGMGAAGGMGAAACAFLGATMLSGIECVLDLVGFDEMLDGCDLCVTGEGHADAQSAHGKVISGIASRCRRANVPCVAVVGGMDSGATELLSCGVDALVPTVCDVTTIEEAFAHAEDSYLLAAQRLFALLKVGAGFGVMAEDT